MEEELGSSSRAIDSSNVGFQLLKKCGWKEGTGLGASEQDWLVREFVAFTDNFFHEIFKILCLKGRLEPLQTHVKKNKRGLGAEKVKQKLKSPEDPPTSKEDLQSKKKVKSVSKRIRKMQEEEKRMEEREFERAFFREFWPENV